MIQRLVLIFFLSLLISNNSLSNNIFDYSFKNTNFKNSNFYFKILKSDNKITNYNISWTPTNNLVINTNFIYNSINLKSNLHDNKLYYGFNFCLLISQNIHVGFGASTLKFDNNYNTIKWTQYFVDRRFNINNLLDINFGILYSYNNQLSFFQSNIYFSKEIYKNINLGIGYEVVHTSFLSKFYLGFHYSL
tara:strand:+ start:855 stop:1427 length:573 start_codon:yes stop_codon:yes gene_type:complete